MIQPISKENLATLQNAILNEVHNLNNYIAPIKRYDYKHSLPIILSVIIPTTTPQRAMYLAKQEFEPDNWIVDENYENYKTI